MQIVGSARINGRRNDDTNEGQKIGKCDDAAFMVLFRSVLNQGVDRDNEQSAHKTKCSKQEQHLEKTQPVNRDGEREHRHSYGAKRDQAIFDLSSREQSCRVAPDADANSQRCLQIAAVLLVEVQNLTSIKDNYELKQRPQKPEVGIASNGEV